MGRDRELPPPLEMMCLNALWELGEGNVEDVRKVISQDRTLAYTTVLTLLDRLARRGAVSRRKEGRGFRYQPTADRDKVRRIALRLFLDHHFGGSEASLRLFLDGESILKSGQAPEAAFPIADAPPPDGDAPRTRHAQAMATAVGAPLSVPPQE
ncbi:MAG: BlaI/MecI/CopY family transcriptional regulator [Acidobacteriota bacterium]